MIVAIVGLFDSEFTKEISRWQKAMVDAGVCDHTLQSRIGPHMTFVGFETENEALVSDFLEGEFQTWNDGSISLKISSLGVSLIKRRLYLRNQYLHSCGRKCIRGYYKFA